MLHELIGLKDNRLDLGKGEEKININSKDFNINDLKVIINKLNVLFNQKILERNLWFHVIKILSIIIICLSTLENLLKISKNLSTK